MRNGRNGGGKRDEPRALLCTLQIYTTLVNGIALQGESVARSKRWGKEADRSTDKPTYHKSQGERDARLQLSLPHTAFPVSAVWVWVRQLMTQVIWIPVTSALIGVVE